MEEKTQSRTKKIICIILILILLAGSGFGIWYFFIKKNDGDDGGVKGTEVELASYAINKVNKRASMIYDTYAKSSVGSSSIDPLSVTSNRLGSNRISGSDMLDKDDLEMYFESLRMCNTVPAAMDFVINSYNSNVYTNRFELDKTYMARETQKYYDEERTYVYYYTVQKQGSLINCFLTTEEDDEYSVYYLCQINYDFENDKLISAKTIAWQEGSTVNYIMMDIDYTANEFTAVNFLSEKTIDDLMDNKIKYNDIELYNFYRGNIVSNINSIEFEDFSSASDVELIFNTYYNNFAFGIEYENVFDFDNFVINNSFIDAMEYSTNKLDFTIRVNPDNMFEYQYISSWIEYQDVIKLLNDVIDSEILNDKPTTKQLITAYRNRLQERGEYSYNGDLSFEYNADNYLDIIKSNNDLDTFVVSVITSAEDVFECTYQYVNGELTVSSVSQGVEIEAVASLDGTYAIIESINSKTMNVDIPEEVVVNGSTLPVKELKGYSYGRDGLILNIPASITKISYWASAYNIREINVHPDNEVFSSLDGVLYNKNKTEILCYPECKVGNSFTIPEGVVSVPYYAFSYADNVTSLTLAASVEDCELMYFDNIAEFNVATGSTKYSSYEGVLYSADGNTLLCCPQKKVGVLNVKPGTKEFDDDAFYYCELVTEINLPASFEKYEDSTTLGSLAGLTKITVDSNSSKFSSHDGMLYNASGDTLIFCPANKGSVITVKQGTEMIENYAFWNSKVSQLNLPNSLRYVAAAFGGCFNLHTLTIPDSVSYFCFSSYMSYLNEIVISENNPYYSMDENNFIYNKEKTILYFVPGNISGVVTIPSHVTKIATYAFSGREDITEIIVPSTVISFENRAFGYYCYAEKITFQGAVELGSWYSGELFSQNYYLKELTVTEIINEFAWSLFVDCPEFHTINFAGTKSEFESYLSGSYNLDTTVTVHCSDGDLTYSRV